MIKKPTLPKETKTHYFVVEPVFDHYRTVTVIDRCDCCYHKIGSHEAKRGVKIVRYQIKKYKKDSFYYMSKIMEERFLEQKSLYDKYFLGNWDTPAKGSVLKIAKFSEEKI